VNNRKPLDCRRLHVNSLSLETRLTREQTAQALTEHGYRITPKTLAAYASKGTGPRFAKFGKYASYVWGDVLEWAKARCGPTASSTSERDRLRAERQPAQLSHAD
jgi:hypothetical protein